MMARWYLREIEVKVSGAQSGNCDREFRISTTEIMSTRLQGTSSCS